jgi:outer membrane protein insertion porin family
LEKLANNSIKKIIKSTSYSKLALLLFLTTTITFSQEPAFGDGKKYILGGLEVTGLQSYNEQTVKTYTGLRVGQPITVPGDELSAIIKKLWGLELFSDVAMYQTKIVGDKIFLELNILERPTLSNVTIYGVKKRKVDEIIDDTDLKKGKKITESLIANTKGYLEKKYKKQGFLNAKVNIATAVDTTGANTESMVVNVKKGDKVKIKSITFEGNDEVKSKRLRKALGKAKIRKKKLGAFWQRSKYTDEEFKEGLKNVGMLVFCPIPLLKLMKTTSHLR